MAGAGYKLFNTGDVLTAAQVNTYLQEQTVMVFADATARTTALSGVLAEGMMSYLKSDDTVYVYNGSAWVSVANTGDITSVVAGTGLSGGGTSGDVTLNLSTPVSATNGGTAQTTYATGDILYASATNTLTKRTIGSSNQGLIVSGGVPTWGATPQSVMTTTGDLLYASSANTPARLGIGSSGQVLTVSSGIPAWAAASSGSMTLLSTTSLSSTSNSISISASSYLHLFIMFRDVRGTSNNTTLFARFNSDTGGNYTYGQWRKYSTGSGDFQVLRAQTSWEITNQLGTTSGADSLSGSMNIWRCNDTSQIPWELRQLNFNDSAQAGWYHTFGKYNASAAISNLTLIGSTNLSGTVYVYGVN